MIGEPGYDYPEERTAVDVSAASRGDVLLSFVERVAEDGLVLSVGQDGAQRRVRFEPGERLELVWRGPANLRAVPAELIGVDGVGSATPTWRVRLTGPAARGQRRAAVRAPLMVPLDIRVDGQVSPAVSVDLSEGGVRCILTGGTSPVGEQEGAAGTGEDLPPHALQKALEVGDVVATTIDLGDRQVSCDAEVMRRHRREDRRLELSLRFIGLGDRGEDILRRHVFAGLRDLRSRGLI